jgi:hypothetical protein
VSSEQTILGVISRRFPGFQQISVAIAELHPFLQIVAANEPATRVRRVAGSLHLIAHTSLYGL